jgi:hypothetical protein
MAAGTSQARIAERARIALQIHGSGVSAMPSKTRNREDLLAFLELVDQGIPRGRKKASRKVPPGFSTRAVPPR